MKNYFEQPWMITYLCFTGKIVTKYSIKWIITHAQFLLFYANEVCQLLIKMTCTKCYLIFEHRCWPPFFRGKGKISAIGISKRISFLVQISPEPWKMEIRDLLYVSTSKKGQTKARGGSGTPLEILVNTYA